MKFIKLFTVVFCSVSLLSGCIFVSSERDSLIEPYGYEKLKDNKEKISLLNIGSTREEVINVLGQPDASEATSIEDSNYYILYYITQHSNSEKSSVISNSTPIVFKSDLLIGWGSEALDNAK